MMNPQHISNLLLSHLFINHFPGRFPALSGLQSQSL
jgi:hypothetical protein